MKRELLLKCKFLFSRFCYVLSFFLCFPFVSPFAVVAKHNKKHLNSQHLFWQRNIIKIVRVVCYLIKCSTLLSMRCMEMDKTFHLMSLIIRRLGGLLELWGLNWGHYCAACLQLGQIEMALASRKNTAFRLGRTRSRRSTESTRSGFMWRDVVQITRHIDNSHCAIIN